MTGQLQRGTRWLKLTFVAVVAALSIVGGAVAFDAGSAFTAEPALEQSSDSAGGWCRSCWL